MYEPRTYRHWVSDTGLVSFSVEVKETDLLIRADRDLRTQALAATRKYRSELERYIIENPLFSVSLEPISVKKQAPLLVKEMADAAWKAGVGPMAAVAGAIAEAVGRKLLTLSNEVIVENGGDIFMKSSQERLIGVYAGKSKLTGRVAFAIQPEETPLGICTSSGTVGHSLSFGEADAVIVLSPSTSLADAAATAIGNRVSSVDDIQSALQFAQSIEGLQGVAIIKSDRMGLYGQIRIAEIEEN
ncbi:MAG: UPF0280 family protein [Dehalococcoidia bacterium]|nr:MAG: UPF0280 family protein [Dehalococcoidia bacterium]